MDMKYKFDEHAKNRGLSVEFDTDSEEYRDPETDSLYRTWMAAWASGFASGNEEGYQDGYEQGLSDGEGA